jgi:acetyl esterase/lipase
VTLKYLNRKALHNKPTVHITYDEGIQIVRSFLYYASKHHVEDLQAFTRQWVPSPHWVRTESVTIPEEFLFSAAAYVSKQLGPKGVVRVGGEKWWQWRGPAEEMKGEWIEMRNHYNETKKANKRCNRVMLYIHGGAYFFGSVDTHRYMMQRHARKLRGRVFAPEYRLAPQFPFPCALHDCLASYLWLLKSYEPKEIILAGDSAGGGLALSMLVVMRDQGIPLPAGAILISPWVDLTHSFPSIVVENPGDYIPPYGFRHKPSTAWPPPNADDVLKMKKMAKQKSVSPEDVKNAIPAPNSEAEETAVRGYTVHKETPPPAKPAYPGQQQTADPSSLHGEPDNIHVVLDGETVELKDQIQMYTTNQLMSHPLVSPVLQPSLGGLPPLQILSGGGEMLRDEQFYVAHKAANPTAYPPADVYLDEHDPTRETLNKYEPTYVQLQVWDNLCHVAPTLSFTQPAKYMFRSIAQFGSWALARAQNGVVEIEDHAILSPVSTSSSEGDQASGPESALNKLPGDPGPSSVGKAGDPLPAFHEYMIRQRIDKRGHVFPLDPPTSYPVLEIPPSKVGAINPELIRQWLDAKQEWDIRFSKEKLRVQSRRMKELAHGFQDFDGEVPPPSSLAARRSAPGVLPKRHAKKNYGMMMWSGWGSRHDERTMEKQQQAQQSGKQSTRASVDAGQAGAWSSTPALNTQSEKGIKQEPTKGKSRATGPSAVSWDDKECSSNGRLSREAETPSRLSEQTNPGPILILPEVNNHKFTDDNASTRALFHAAGSLPMKSDISLAQSRYTRPSSAAGSATARSEMVSDTASTVGGDKDSAAHLNMSSDAASTRALMGASGVSAQVMAGENGRRSTDTLSVLSTAGRDSMSHRPEMPDREVFKTAQEGL